MTIHFNTSMTDNEKLKLISTIHGLTQSVHNGINTPPLVDDIDFNTEIYRELIETIADGVDREIYNPKSNWSSIFINGECASGLTVLEKLELNEFIDKKIKTDSVKTLVRLLSRCSYEHIMQRVMFYCACTQITDWCLSGSKVTEWNLTNKVD